MIKMPRRAAFIFAFAVAASVLAASAADATGLATCDSGPQSGWKPEDQLRKQLSDQGWQIRRIKIDGGCYEVYAIDDKGRRVEAYFHPLTFQNVHLSVR